MSLHLLAPVLEQGCAVHAVKHALRVVRRRLEAQVCSSQDRHELSTSLFLMLTAGNAVLYIRDSHPRCNPSHVPLGKGMVQSGEENVCGLYKVGAHL